MRHTELTREESVLLLVLERGWHVARHYAPEAYARLEELGLSKGVGWRATITPRGLAAVKTMTLSSSVWVTT